MHMISSWAVVSPLCVFNAAQCKTWNILISRSRWQCLEQVVVARMITAVWQEEDNAKCNVFRVHLSWTDYMWMNSPGRRLPVIDVITARVITCKWPRLAVRASSLLQLTVGTPTGALVSNRRQGAFASVNAPLIIAWLTFINCWKMFAFYSDL